MNIRYLLVLAMLSYLMAGVFADCVGYTDSFDVRVLDPNFRPIEGAAVTVTFDRGTSFGEQYFTTTPRYTDARGIVHFDIMNQGNEMTPREIDCGIVIDVSVGGADAGESIEANIHGNIVDVTMAEVYPLRFYVKDQLGVPLTNASVTVAGITNRTDSKGLVRYNFVAGDYDYLANYLDAQEAGTLTIANDTMFEVIFAHYAVSITVTDDAGEPLNCTLTIINQTLELPDGKYQNGMIFGEEIPYSMGYAGLVREGTIMAAAVPDTTIVYDTHAPLFGDIVPGEVGGKPQLTIIVTDPNEHASGIDPSGVRVQYKVEPSDETTPWGDAVMFTSGRNKFTAQFPDLPPDAIVRFKVEARDQDGNRASIEGKFSTLSLLPTQNDTQNNTQNNTENQTGPQEPPEDGQGIPFLYIFGGIIILVLAIYVVFRLKTKVTKGS